MKTQKKTHKMLLMVAACLVLAACGEKRDCEQEYYDMNSKTFPSARQGYDVANDYLGHFKPSKCAYYSDVEKIRDEFADMDRFFSNRYDDYGDFQRAALQTSFQYSSYSTIVNTWKALVEKEQHRLLDAIIDRITPNDIGNYMYSQSMKICGNDYGGNGPFGWTVTGASLVSLSDLEPIGNNLFGKKCTGVYRVSMEGAMGLGLRSGTAKIQIVGSLYVDTYGNLQYHTLDYRYLETTGQVPER